MQRGENFVLDRETHKNWIKLLNLKEDATMLDLIAGQVQLAHRFTESLEVISNFHLCSWLPEMLS